MAKAKMICPRCDGMKLVYKTATEIVAELARNGNKKVAILGRCPKCSTVKGKIK